MSLNWNWNDKCGEATLVQKRDDKEYEYTLTLYDGNAWLIMLHGHEDERGEVVYDLHSFWADKEHMKRMLGLDKKHGYKDNYHEEDWSKITKFRLNKDKLTHFKDIVPAIAQAFSNVTIEIYSDEEV